MDSNILEEVPNQCRTSVLLKANLHILIYKAEISLSFTCIGAYYPMNVKEMPWVIGLQLVLIEVMSLV